VKKMLINNLPPEVLYLVFSWLTSHYLYFARQTCSHWRRLAVALLRQKPNFYGNFALTLMRNGHFELLKLLVGPVFEPDSHHMNLALSCGRMEIAQWLLENGPGEGCPRMEISRVSMNSAMKSGDRATIEWAFDEYIKTAGPDALADSKKHLFISTPSLETLQLVDQLIGLKNIDFDGSYRDAAEKGRLDTITWLVDTYGIPSPDDDDDENPCHVAAWSGDLEIIKPLHDHGFKLQTGIMDAACFSGNTKLITWLLDHGVDWEKTNGHFLKHGLEFMLWCLERGFRINPAVVLQGGCDEFDPRVYYWIVERYGASSVNSDVLLDAAMCSKKYFRFLINRGAVWSYLDDETQYILASNVKFLIQRGLVAWNPHDIVWAALCDDFKLIRWAWRTGKKFPPADKITHAKPYLARWLAWQMYHKS
jgi:F-box-like